METGQLIKKLREDQGMTLEELGQKVGVGKSTVRKWETGIISNMRRDKIVKLSDALGVTPAYLLGWEESSAEDFNIVFSRRLKYYMEKNEMTQKELADKLGVGIASVSFWCNGVKSPRMDKVDKMCDIFQCNRSDLIEDKSNDTNPDILELTPKEATHIENYRCLDDLDKARIDERMDVMLEDEKYHKKDITIAG